MEKHAQLRGVILSRTDILKALRDFDDQYPNTNDYERWLQNRTYKYAILHAGKRYPPKHIVRCASGVVEFEATEAQRVLRQLCFEVVAKTR